MYILLIIIVIIIISILLCSSKTIKQTIGGSQKIIIPLNASQESIDTYHHMEGMLNRKWAKNGNMSLEKALKIYNPISMRKFYDLSGTVFSDEYFKNINVRSKLFEKRIQEILGDKVYKTEEELKGQSLTPDFLLKDMGKYKWLDAKNYPHFDSRMTRKKLKKQAKKYTDAFGPGIFVFDGIWCDIPILDTKIISIENLQKFVERNNDKNKSNIEFDQYLISN